MVFASLRSRAVAELALAYRRNDCLKCTEEPDLANDRHRSTTSTRTYIRTSQPWHTWTSASPLMSLLPVRPEQPFKRTSKLGTQLHRTLRRVATAWYLEPSFQNILALRGLRSNFINANT